MPHAPGFFSIPLRRFLESLESKRCVIVFILNHCSATSWHSMHKVAKLLGGHKVMPRSMIFTSNFLLLVDFCLAMMMLILCHKFSMGFKSGDSAGKLI